MKNGREVTSESGKADIFNQFFSSVYTQETTDKIPAPRRIQVKKQLLDIEISEQDVLKLLKQTKVNKSPDLDGIHPRVLKECAAELAALLATLFRKTLQEGKIPPDWREASITPIYKTGKGRMPPITARLA